MLTAQSTYEALVIAVISVNNYPLQKAWDIREALKSAGLFDPETLASIDRLDLVARLRTAGYDRGAFLTNLIASRLKSLGVFLANQGIGRATSLLSSGTADEVRGMLIKIKGVGDRVVENFLLLREHTAKSATTHKA